MSEPQLELLKFKSKDLADIENIIDKVYQVRQSIQSTILTLSGQQTIQKGKSTFSELQKNASDGFTKISELVALVKISGDAINRLGSSGNASESQTQVPDWVPKLLTKYPRLAVGNGNIDQWEDSDNDNKDSNDLSKVDNNTIDSLDGLDKNKEIDEGNALESIDSINSSLKHSKVQALFHGEKKLNIYAVIPNTIQMSINCDLKSESEDKKYIVISNISVKAPKEGDDENENEVHGQSKFRVFRAVEQDLSQQLMLNNDNKGKLTVGKLYDILQLFDQYNDLFRSKCVKCLKHLQYDFRFGQFTPPTCRKPITTSTTTNTSNKGFEVVHQSCLE